MSTAPPPRSAAQPGVEPATAGAGDRTTAYTGFALEDAWELDPRVSLRSEAFGALAYHFGTRRLSFLKTRKLAQVVEGLAQETTAAAACRAAGVTPAELSGYAKALGQLAATEMIRRREVLG